MERFHQAELGFADDPMRAQLIEQGVNVIGLNLQDGILIFNPRNTSKKGASKDFSFSRGTSTETPPKFSPSFPLPRGKSC